MAVLTGGQADESKDGGVAADCDFVGLPAETGDHKQ
jgi:hypothetical protein